jgi:hypothetical protein
LGNAPAHLFGICTPKNTFASTIKLAKLSEITFYQNEKSEKEFSKLTLFNSKFGEHKIWRSQNIGEHKIWRSQKIDKPSTREY